MEQRMQLEDLADSVRFLATQLTVFLHQLGVNKLLGQNSSSSHQRETPVKNFGFTFAVHFHFQYCPDLSGLHALLHFRSLLTGLPSIFE